VTAPLAADLADDIVTMLEGTVLHVVRGDEADGYTPPADSDGRPLAYVVVWPGAGRAAHDRIVPVNAGIDWQVQVTCVGGTLERCLTAAAIARSTLAGEMVPDGYRLREVGADDGIPRPERDARPVRYATALFYALSA
jgi:hypothetical protein